MVFNGNGGELAETKFTLVKDRDVFYERDGQSARPAFLGWPGAWVDGGG